MINKKTDKLQVKLQPSESFLIGAVMAVAGGFMDAYTYTQRDHVFANAITGNLVLLGLNTANANYIAAMSYLIPLLAFAAGVLISTIIRRYFQFNRVIHWRLIILLIEIILLFAVGFMPASLNWAANAVISLRCAIQIVAFKKFRGNAAATTMCTGNLRSGTELIFRLITEDNKREILAKILVYYGLILFFVLGAISGTIFSEMVGIKAIWICCLLLLLPVFIILDYKGKYIESI